jgi:Domain of unknown function (DUF4910)
MKADGATQSDPDLAVARMRRCFAPDPALRLLEEITRHDRFQASVGIERAADAVAAAAEAVGLEKVEIHRWHTDGSPRWWTFAGPPSWTPEHASLVVSSAGRSELAVAHPTDPFALASYSRATPPQGATHPLRRASELADGDAAGSMLLMDRGLPSDLQLAELGERGIAGFLGSPGWPTTRADRLRRRIELPFGADAFAFSLSTEEMRRLSAIEGGLEARARLSISSRGRMPVVTGLLPGYTSEEILVLSHLCHPRPSANDNASGAAANLAAAACLSAAPCDRRYCVRFLWGPEFVGTVAYLHDLVTTGLLSEPIEAVNLDVVGQAGSALRVEHPPAHLPALLPAAIERCLGSAQWDEEGAAGRAARWETAAFAGTSDHAVLADRQIGIPASHLGQIPDRFNHSSGDSLDRVDIRPLCRASVSVAAAIETIAQDPAPETLGRWLSESAARRLRLDPFGRGEYVREALQRSFATTKARSVTGRLQPMPIPLCSDDGHRPLERLWDGPFNLRGMLERLPRSNRDELDRLLPEDRRAAYTAMLSLAIEIDAGRSGTSVTERASSLSGQAIDPRLANSFFDALCAVGWARPGSR